MTLMSRGSALLLTLIISLILALCGVTLFLLARFLLAQAMWDIQKVKASFAAEAGVQFVINEILSDLRHPMHPGYDQSKWPCEQQICSHDPRHRGKRIEQRLGEDQIFRVVEVKYMERGGSSYKGEPYISERVRRGDYSIVEIITEGECKKWRRRAHTYFKIVQLQT